VAYKPKPSTAKDNGVFVYVGPSIRGTIQNGSIYCGTRESVIGSLCSAIEKFPMIERLIVADKDIVSAKQKIAHGNNSLSLAFRELSKN